MGLKYAVNKDFFKIWNQKMAYVLGYLYADGSLADASYLRGKYISVTSIDKNTIVKIRHWLDSKHTIVECIPSTPNGHIRYLLRIGSHELYKDLTKLGLYPNKSLTITFPKIPGKYLSHFVRGYFDGDGCIYFQKAKGITRDIIIRRLRTIFVSGSKKFLIGLMIVLKNNLNINQDKVYRGHKSYQLMYSTNDSIEVFKFLYKNVENEVFLERKCKIFLDYFAFRSKKLDKSVNNVIKYLNGHVVK